MSNPYTLVFGQPPAELIERAPQADRIISDFRSGAPSSYLNLITGVRGSGKTVFMTEIADRLLKDEPDRWIIVNLNPKRDLLLALAAKLNSNAKLSRIFQDANINLEFFGFGIGIKTAPPITDIEEALTRMLRSLKKHGKRVLVTIDEATNSEQLRIFASTYQIFLREKLPIFLLMTGLFKNIDKLKNANGMTFLERAPRTTLGPLNLDLVAEKYMATLKLPQDTALQLAALTRGYSFAFQILGYFSWEFPADEGLAVSRAKAYLYEFAYHKIWSELSRKDRQLVQAMAQTPTGRVFEIREKLNYSSNQLNPYRNRLIKAGIATSPENGFLLFALPFFEDYVLAMTDENPMY